MSACQGDYITPGSPAVGLCALSRGTAARNGLHGHFSISGSLALRKLALPLLGFENLSPIVL
jgi:hypothetical protein